MKKITVIIPCFNASEYIDVCLNNITSQTIGFDDIEVILIDDASNDDGKTIQKLRDFESLYQDNVILIENAENRGAGGCRNEALMYASGEYTSFCDADDWLDISSFEILYSVAKQQDAEVVDFKWESTYQHDGVSGEHTELMGSLDEIDSVLKRKRYALPGDFDMICCNKLYRTEMLKKYDIRFHENTIYEETPFTCLVRLYAERYYKLEASFYHYYQRSDSSSKEYYNRTNDVRLSYDMYLEETKIRGLYNEFKDEIAFTYWSGYFLLPLLNIAKNGSFCDKQEYIKLQKHIGSQIEDIRGNKYLEEFLPNRKILGDLTYVDVDKIDYNDICEYFYTLAKG